MVLPTARPTSSSPTENEQPGRALSVVVVVVFDCCCSLLWLLWLFRTHSVYPRSPTVQMSPRTKWREVPSHLRHLQPSSTHSKKNVAPKIPHKKKQKTRALIWSTALDGRRPINNKARRSRNMSRSTAASTNCDVQVACGRLNWAGGYSQERPFEKKKLLCSKRLRIHVLKWPVRHQKKKNAHTQNLLTDKTD